MRIKCVDSWLIFNINRQLIAILKKSLTCDILMLNWNHVKIQGQNRNTKKKKTKLNQCSVNRLATHLIGYMQNCSFNCFDFNRKGTRKKTRDSEPRKTEDQLTSFRTAKINWTHKNSIAMEYNFLVQSQPILGDYDNGICFSHSLPHIMRCAWGI